MLNGSSTIYNWIIILGAQHHIKNPSSQFVAFFVMLWLCSSPSNFGRDLLYVMDSKISDFFLILFCVRKVHNIFRYIVMGHEGLNDPILDYSKNGKRMNKKR